MVQTEGILGIPSELPILPLRGVVVYPMMWLPLTVGQPRSIRLVDDVVVEDRMIGLVTAKNVEQEEPGPDDVYSVGTAAIVHRLLKAPDGTVRLIVQGLERIRIGPFTQVQPYLRAYVQPAPEVLEETVEMEALMRNAVDIFRRLISLVPHLPEELEIAAMNVDDARQLVYLIASSLRLDIQSAQEILEIDRVRDKLVKLTILLNKELEVLELGRKIQSEAQSEMEKMQREYFLREQMKAIRKELGEEDETAAEIKEIEERIAAAGMPEEAEKEAKRELDRMRKMPPQAAEYSVIKTYLDWMTSLPWQKSTEDNLDIAHARQVLEEDHYGLEDIKERILEFLAVRNLRLERKEEREAAEAEGMVDYIRREREGVILCFIGPPGTGKTSLGRSIARAMGRKFIRMSLGGIRDEAEIRGFRRTYIGSMPGRIIQMLRRVESKNPVFMLDEIDKLGHDYRGDPSSALLEVLDPEQNVEFRDHYLDVPFDLSQVFFITTGNWIDPIPGPLRDRMEIIELSSYTEEEKVKIAEGYLIPRQIRENGLRPEEIRFEEAAVRRVIREYTREAGVRNLERELGSICRKVATKVAEKGEGAGGETTVITAESVPDYLGKRKYYDETAERLDIPGVAIALAWTPTGGDILFIEATRMAGNKGFIITGQLGDIMKESAQAALSYVRSKAAELGIPEGAFEKHDIHLHIPAGATPKDGPSAGVTMATALASLFTGRKVRPNLGMTGEITLRGKVLPIGGVKEKVLAAYRAGLDTAILPARNEKDLDEVPEEVRNKMRFIFVERMDEVLAAALLDATEHAAQDKQSVE
ncbi:MAG: endopeptidase La [Anaerolineae bacterium]|nr:endopeptidase La [Anaerolineae bacterium]